MSKIRTLVNLLKSDKRVLLYAIFQKCNFLFCDSFYLRLLFWLKIRHKLDLNNPKSYNEKLQWLKLYNRRPEYKIMVDKCDVKQYVSQKIGSEYVIPTYGVWDHISQIDWNSLPNQFVIKTTHGGGGCGVVVCKDKKSLNIKKTVAILKSSLKQDIYKSLREWPYKNMKKRIIAEQYLEDPGLQSLNDYKVMCFDGKVRLIEYHEGRFSSQHTQSFYDREWNKLPINQKSYGAISNDCSEKPALLEKMIELSEVLAKDIPHVRIDWYIVKERLYFGEITFYDASGFDPFIPDEYNYIIGDWITLPEKTVNN